MFGNVGSYMGVRDEIVYTPGFTLVAGKVCTFSASAIVYTRWRLSFFPAAGLMIKMCFKKLTPMQFAIFNIPQVI